MILVLCGVALIAYHAPAYLDTYRHPCWTYNASEYCRTYSREWLVSGLILMVGGAFAYREGTKKAT